MKRLAIERLYLPLILLLALVLRLYELNGQSLWYDEGTSVVLAQQSAPTIISSAAADIHPPLYYLLLNGWVHLFGTGEIAVRALSVLSGVVLVYVTYLLGRRLFGWHAGLAAALLAALSPFQVYYSQEARMYMLAALLSAVSTLLMLIALFPQGRQPRARWLAVVTWISYILVTTAALYTHYFSATVILAQDIALSLLLLGSYVRRPADGLTLRAMAPLAAAQVAVAICYTPWLPAMAGQFSNWPAISEFYNLLALVARLLPIFSLGLSAASVPALTLLAFGLVLLAGMMPSLPSTSSSAGLFARPVAPQLSESSAVVLAACWLAIPVLTMFVLSLRRPMYNPKFLLVATPALYLLLGRGLRWLWASPRAGRAAVVERLLAAGAFSVLIAGSLASLSAYYSNPLYARDDYRAVVRAIDAGARRGDVIVLNAPGQTDIFGYYYKGDLAVVPLPRQRPPDEAATTQELASLAEGDGSIWVVYYGDQQSDPQRIIESWLDKHGYKASDRWFGNVRLALYATRPGSTATSQPIDVHFGPSIRLAGERMDTIVASGDVASLTLYWQTDAPVADRYVVFAHLIDSNGKLWGQHDSEPAGGSRPTNTWQVGETVQDNHGIRILPATPPGDYQIEVGMYRSDNGQRLPVTDATGKPLGDHILLGPLTITRSVTPPLDMQHAANAVTAGLRLLGYNVEKLGQDGVATALSADDVAHVTLFWSAWEHPLADLTTTIQVLDSRGQVVRQSSAGPVDGNYPTSSWRQGEIVRDQYHLPLAGLAPGRYQLVVDVRDAAGQPVGRIDLGPLTVK
jgi:mannosyltransferase